MGKGSSPTTVSQHLLSSHHLLALHRLRLLPVLFSIVINEDEAEYIAEPSSHEQSFHNDIITYQPIYNSLYIRIAAKQKIQWHAPSFHQ
jgi:hypothetical protein